MSWAERIRTVAKRVSRPAALAAMAAVVAAVSFGVGCDVDSFMDPSEVGRYENTPVVLPILDRLAVIDEPVDRIPGLSQVRSQDLIPEVQAYVIGPGDMLTVTIFELIRPGVESVQTRRVNQLGYIRLPVVGQVKAEGRTAKELEQRIKDILDPDVLRDPTVTVVIQEGRQRTFNVIGTQGTGTYTIQGSNFRLLDAIALSGGLPTGTETVYVVRQVPLHRMAEKGYRPERQREPADDEADGSGEDGGKRPSLDPGGVIENLSKGLKRPADQPSQQGNGNGAEGGSGSGQSGPADGAPSDGDGEEAGSPMQDAVERPGRGAGRFINVGGEWVWIEDAQEAAKARRKAKGERSAKKKQSDGSGKGDAPAEPSQSGQRGKPGQGLPAPEQMMTQRVIEIDAEALQSGEARYNIVIRPGDVIRVPSPTTGNVYIGGHISRPGTYTIPPNGDLTLKQLVTSAGGLSPTAIPERVDLTRRLGDEREATVRLNLRAIFEGVQPDIFLKPNDQIMVGTNLFASHAAVIRNSFRFSYGFGFLLDRNFGRDVFGPPPRSGVGDGGGGGGGIFP